MFGEMLRRPRIATPEITASYCKFILDEKQHYCDGAQRHEVRDAAVQHAVWRGPEGTIGYVFANVSEEPVTFEVELSSYCAEPGSYDVDRVTDGEREAWLRATSLPRRVSLALQPLSVMLVEVREAEGKVI